MPLLGLLSSLLSRRIKKNQKVIVAETTALAGSTTEALRNIIDPARELFAEMSKIDELYRRNKITVEEWMDATLEAQGRLRHQMLDCLFGSAILHDPAALQHDHAAAQAG